MSRIVQKIDRQSLPVPSKKRVAAYTRVSGIKDSMICSLSAQVSYYSEYIQNHKGWEYAGVYTDEAISGTKDGRASFQRLLTDCRNGLIDMVITKSISRFARNTVTMLNVVRELKTLNVDVFFEKESIHSISGDGELMLTILASFAQEESRSVSENCKWRIRNNYKAGIPNTFKIFGFDVVSKQIAINIAEAEIVRLIFDEYLSGKGRLLIAKKLNDMGVKTKRGNEWDSAKIREILRNEKYTGDLMLQKEFVSSHMRKLNIINDGKLPKYYIEDNHDPIIDRETFAKVQQEFEKRTKTYSTEIATTKTYPFTGNLVCSMCGKHYQRKLNNARGKYQKAIWICSTYNRLGKDKCSARQIPESVLEKISTEFKKKIRHITVHPDNILMIMFSDTTQQEIKWNY